MRHELDAADARLRSDEVLWLTTVNDRTQPQSSPVWFHWNGTDVLILSRPGATKVANIARHPGVALHLNGGDAGTLVVSIEATASIERGVADGRRAAYAEKYQRGFERLGTDARAYFAEYSTAIVARPQRVRRFGTK